MLIRHGETAGNQKQRYIGRRTDEPLLPQSQEVLKQLDYGEPPGSICKSHAALHPDCVYSFSGKPLNIIDELAECDFGNLRTKLSGVGRQCKLPGMDRFRRTSSIPGRESREEFKRRNITGFQMAVGSCIRKIFPAPHWWYMAAPL